MPYFVNRGEEALSLLIERATRYETHVKILVPIEDKITDIIKRLDQIKWDTDTKY